MQVRPHGIGVTVCCPLDTDTPGFEEEQKSKPEECKIFSGSATPVDPDYVARFVTTIQIYLELCLRNPIHWDLALIQSKGALFKKDTDCTVGKSNDS